ncbi:MAG: hypothetical protein B6229_06685 [Spirochaetaceae bacterium 4572_7]|nr:MAG: hypothetical protein B6229_06685 [Spirochaetaceae bacterium 4572_7]
MTVLLKNSLKLILVLIITSCSVSAPEIKGSKWSISLVKDLRSDQLYEKLSIFVNCYDEDGEDDIDVIYFIDDESGLFWELDQDSWLVRQEESSRWLGSNSIVMANRTAIPRNSFRIFVRDLSGESTTDKIYITKRPVILDDITFPDLQIDDGNVALKEYENGTITIYSSTGEVLKSVSIDGNVTSFRTLFGQGKGSFDHDSEIFLSVDNGAFTLESGPWELSIFDSE